MSEVKFLSACTQYQTIHMKQLTDTLELHKKSWKRFAADIDQIRKQVADSFNKLYVKSKFSQKLHNLQEKGGEKNTISQP